MANRLTKGKALIGSLDVQGELTVNGEAVGAGGGGGVVAGYATINYVPYGSGSEQLPLYAPIDSVLLATMPANPTPYYTRAQGIVLGVEADNDNDGNWVFAGQYDYNTMALAWSPVSFHFDSMYQEWRANATGQLPVGFTLNPSYQPNAKLRFKIAKVG